MHSGQFFQIHPFTYTRLTALFPGLPGWAGTRKVKRIWILLKQETVFFENEHLNFVKLSKYTPRYLADISHLTEWPDTTISAQAFLNCGPKHIHADFPTLIAMSRNSSSEALISTSDCKAWTDGASKITSSAYRNIAVQFAPILQPIYWPYLYTYLSHQ